MDKSDIATRMKEYECVSRQHLTRRLPMIIRVDGKAFHTLTRKLKFVKPFDETMMAAMIEVGRGLLKEIQGAKLVYIQSDEANVLATDYEEIQTQAWFDKNVQKITSVSASIATMCFNRFIQNTKTTEIWGLFDARVFVLPQDEVANYFIWRQQDCTRNSIQSVGQANFSHKALHNFSGKQIQEKLFQEKGINWNNLENCKKRGVCLLKQQMEKEFLTPDNTITKAIRTEIIVDKNIPVFTEISHFPKERHYINQWI